MPALRLYLLGWLDLRHDGQRLPRPPTSKSQSLLAYLAIHRGQPQPRERLADLFWGDRPERRARRSLTTALWHIRRCLPDEQVLLADAHCAQFDPRADLWLDVAEFESLAARPALSSLQSAVDLYRGDFMDGFYDDWILNERYRLEALFQEALAHLMTGWEAQGAHDQALATALRLLQHDALREDAHRLAMRALCALGQRSAALEQYRRCQKTLEQELGADPSAETTELHEAILDGRMEIGPPAEARPVAVAIPAPAPPAGHDPLDPILRSRLVGRGAELAWLQECFERARSGHGGLALVHGEAGVGKSRLLEDWATHLRWQGVRVLWGRCYEFERLLPYQPLGEALQPVLSAMAPSDLSKLPGWMLAELARLVPEVSEKLPDLDANATVPPEQQQTHLFQAVLHLLAKLAADDALVLILDDLHWATESTLQMVHYLARHLGNQKVLILAALRPEAAGPQQELGALEQQLSREGLACTLHLARLSPQDVEAIVVGLSGAEATVAPLARRLSEETEGNPFYLMEMVKGLFDSGLIHLEDGAWRGDFPGLARAELPLPTGLSEAIQARARRLDKDARAALSVAAILGQEFDFDLWNTAWEGKEEATLEALDALLRRQFIREGSGALGRDYAFHHHKIREVVYAALPLRRRQHLHARVGRAMEALYIANLEGVAGELGFHYEQGRHADAELAPRAVRFLLLAGDQARLAYAHGEAIDYYNRALALQEEMGQHEGAGRTLMKLGLAYHSGFDFARAHQAFEEGFAHWQQAGDWDAGLAHTPLPAAPHALRIRWRCPYTLDPSMSEDYVSSRVIDQLFRGLVSLSPELDVVPEVAQSWQVLDGGRRYRFHLRPDARWSDGHSLTARDFVYAWKRALDPATSGDPQRLQVIKGARDFQQGKDQGGERLGVRALDDRTLDVELEEPVSHFLYLLTEVNACPVPQHVVARHGSQWTAVGTMVSNGPFTLKAWDRVERMELARNPLYGRPSRGNVQQVELHFPASLSVPLEQYVRGELDVLTMTDAAVQEADRIRRQFAAEYLSAPWPFTIYLAFVTSRPPFDDLRLRQALAMGCDRERLANVVLRGMYSPGSGGFVPQGMPGHSPGIGLPYDPQRARRLLAAAGHPGGDGLAVLDALTVPPIDPLITQFLQAQWQENLGIQVRWEVLDWPLFSGRLREDPPQLYILAAIAAGPDPGGFVAADFLREETRWANPAHEKLVEQARLALDQPVRLALLRQADAILVREAPVVPLFYGRQHMLIKPWVRSFPISPVNRWHCEDAVIEPH